MLQSIGQHIGVRVLIVDEITHDKSKHVKFMRLARARDSDPDQPTLL